jgi:FkbM family methyltransferase
MSDLILYGSGTTGRYIARNLNAAGTPPLCFVDSDSKKHGLVMEGIEVVAPAVAKTVYPDATWIASSIVPVLWREITAEIDRLGVKTVPVWEFLPQRTAPPTRAVFEELLRLVDDPDSLNFLWDQWHLRTDPAIYTQMPPADIADIYFPDFITHRDDEHYVDCGAADGDTVREFHKRWQNYSRITAFEPDAANFRTAEAACFVCESANVFPFAISDHQHRAEFHATGDYSAHLEANGNESVLCLSLDKLENLYTPTYIKMDIEGSEPAALWGARRILKEHKPVLAICAYHESEHFWSIPLLVHALQPEYRLFFRRYAEGSFEIVWYAVPPERIQ